MLPPSLVDAVRRLRRTAAFADLVIICITRRPEQAAKVTPTDVPVEIIRSDLTDAREMRQLLQPFLAGLCGVVCRGDKNVQYFRRLLPLLPAHISVPTDEALLASTHKHLMRQKFAEYAPAITPQFVRISAPGTENADKVEARMAYPVIVKPTNLASSLLVQLCRSRAELERVLKKTFAHIQRIYDAEERTDRPHVVVEEYLEGALYSIDAYITGDGTVYCCPPLRYIPAKQLGVDDFFIYKRFLPAGLSAAEVARATAVAEQAVHAVGLTASSAHIELIRTRAGWKIIELGPRLGRFRHQMYGLAYGIDHSLNDIKVRLGLPPEISHRRKSYCAGYCIYPHTEGKLRTIHGLRELETRSDIRGLKVFAEPGDPCRMAKHGGHALAEFLVIATTKAAFGQVTQHIEKTVAVDIDNNLTK